MKIVVLLVSIVLAGTFGHWLAKFRSTPVQSAVSITVMLLGGTLVELIFKETAYTVFLVIVDLVAIFCGAILWWKPIVPPTGGYHQQRFMPLPRDQFALPGDELHVYGPDSKTKTTAS